MTTRISPEEKQERIEFLRKYIYPGAKLYLVSRHTSSSGVLHVFEVYSFADDRWTTALSYNTAKLLGYKYCEKRHGIRMEVGGMDAGADLVYQLCRVLGVPFDEVRYEWL